MRTKRKEIPEVDIVIDEQAGVIREVKPEGVKLRSKRRHERQVNALVYAVLIVISVIWLLPFVFLVLQSFRSYLTESGGMVNYLIPKQFSLDNYVYLFHDEYFFTWYGNTLIIAVSCAVIQTAIVLSVSYALSRLRFHGRKLFMNIVLILGMFPGFLTMIALYFLLKQIGLTQEGAVPGLILVYCASAGMDYYIAKGFFDTIPKSLDESARIDGASRFQVFYKIIMPLSKPIVIYTILKAFMGPWGEYVFASYIAFGRTESYNVAVGMYRWMNVTDYQGYFTRFCAGGVLVAIPVTLLFLLLEKYYVEGITGGAVKG